MQTIRFERDSAVGRIVLANPPFNRLDLGFSECLRQAVHDASESDVRVVLITVGLSAGEAVAAPNGRPTISAGRVAWSMSSRQQPRRRLTPRRQMPTPNPPSPPSA